MSRKAKHKPDIYGSAKEQGDTFVSMYSSMLQSPAYTSMSVRARHLLVICRDRIYGHRSPDDVQSHFNLTKTIWHNVYVAYSANGDRQFRDDMQTLIRHGFVDIIKDGSQTHTANIYGLSTRWKKYGAEDYKLPTEVQTFAMLRKLENNLRRNDGMVDIYSGGRTARSECQKTCPDTGA